MPWGGPDGEDVLDLLVQAVEHVLQGGDGPATLCRSTAAVFAAEAAAHAQYRPASTCVSLCMWRKVRPDVEVVVHLDLLEPPCPVAPLRRAAEAWWLRSTARAVVLEWLDQPHLSELPLSIHPAQPSLLVLGRRSAFSSSETARLARARRLLLALEQVAERLAASGAVPVGGADGDASRTAGTDPLTGREREVLVMLSEGLLARSIAQRLAVSERTVHKHLGNLYRKLDVHDRLLAVRRGEDLGLLPPERPSRGRQVRAR